MLIVPMLVLALTPLIEPSFGYASRPQAARAGEPEPPGAQGADRPGARHVPPRHHHRAAWWRRRPRPSAPTRCSARTCAYYHDIGKGKNPLYFGENQKGENRHDSLAPGDERGDHQAPRHRRARAGAAVQAAQLVADAIAQHHGTRLVGYFFHKAVKEQEGKERAAAVDEASTATPGPQARSSARRRW